MRENKQKYENSYRLPLTEINVDLREFTRLIFISNKCLRVIGEKVLLIISDLILNNKQANIYMNLREFQLE